MAMGIDNIVDVDVDEELREYSSSEMDDVDVQLLFRFMSAKMPLAQTNPEHSQPVDGVRP